MTQLNSKSTRTILQEVLNKDEDCLKKLFWKIINNEFFYPNSFDYIKDFFYNLRNFLFEYNHLRWHRGLGYFIQYEKYLKDTELLR